MGSRSPLSTALGVTEPKQEALEPHPSWAERMYPSKLGCVPMAHCCRLTKTPIYLPGASHAFRITPILTLHHCVACVELSTTSHSTETGYLAVLLALLDGGVDVMTCGIGRLTCSGLFPEGAEGFVRRKQRTENSLGTQTHRDGGYRSRNPVLTA